MDLTELLQFLSEYGVPFLRGLGNLPKLLRDVRNGQTQQLRGDISAQKQVSWELGNRVTVLEIAIHELQERNVKKIDFNGLDVDVIAAIFDAAKTKGSDYMRNLMARLLAGEIQNPGSFSIRTIRSAEQLDHKIATIFQNLCSISCALRVTIENAPLGLNPVVVDDRRVLSLDTAPSDNGLGDYGLSYGNLLLLSEYGLIVPEIDTRTDYWFCVVQQRKTVTATFHHQERDWVLMPTDATKTFDHLWLSGVMFSSVGRELSTIVDTISNGSTQTYTSKLQERFMRDELRMVQVSNQS